MKILVLQGSPRPMARSNTYAVTQAFLRGMGQEHSVDVIDVNRQNIKHCLGCFGCWNNTPGKCVQRDDMDSVLPKYADADLVIWSLPLYYFGMPSQIKALMDRTLPLACGDIIATEDGRGTHPLRQPLHMKHLVISTCGFPGGQNNFDAMKLQFQIAFTGAMAGYIFVPEGEILLLKELSEYTNPLYARAQAAGEEYAKTGALSQPTQDAFLAPMIPFEMYANH